MGAVTNDNMIAEIAVLKTEVKSVKERVEKTAEQTNEKLDAITAMLSKSDILEERIKVANRRIENLEKEVKEQRNDFQRAVNQARDEIAKLRVRLTIVAVVLTAAIGGIDLIKALL
ncbi:MAG: hypothetical protein LBF86_01980 [Helicobacteraceae bacterium]|jgi:uncharacterized coiled-coil DUF342 family protein|nr:hypothetical protein [Helicobacteraceae bacterium]